jgi:hypothetical protein
MLPIVAPVVSNTFGQYKPGGEIAVAVTNSVVGGDAPA